MNYMKGIIAKMMTSNNLAGEFSPVSALYKYDFQVTLRLS